MWNPLNIIIMWSISDCDGNICVHNLKKIGTRVIQEQIQNSALGVTNIFDNVCHANSGFYQAPDSFNGKAFTLDLGTTYNLKGFFLRNTHNR